MSKLKPLVEQFVNQVLDVVRRAPIEDVLRIASASAPHAPRQFDSFRESGGSGRGRVAKRRAALAPLPVENEITDPELLLAAVIESPVVRPAPRIESRPRATSRPEKPATEPVVVPPTVIREGESIVRASGGGVVIRRRPSQARLTPGEMEPS